MPIENAPFKKSEYERRLQKSRTAMQEAGLDVLFVSDPSNMAWLTGYDGWSFYVFQGVILEADGDPFWWGRMQDTQGALRTVFMEPDRVLGYEDHYVQSTTSHPMQDLAHKLTQMGYGNARIGVEMDNYYFSAKAFEVLQASLPDASLVDATGLVNWQRAVKSDVEFDFMRKAAKITEKIVRLALDEAQIGMRKNQLVAKIMAAGVEGVGDDWGDYPAIVPLLPSGSDASAPHLTWNGDELREGEATFFELSGCYRRYHAPLCRSLFLGKPPQFMLDAAKALNEGLAAGLEAARAGNPAGDVARALGQVMQKIGIDRKGARCGYPIGLSYPPDWGERTVSFRESDETILQAGMTFHFMPGLWMDGWGLETTETIVIKESGAAETLCQLDRKLFVKE